MRKLAILGAAVAAIGAIQPANAALVYAFELNGDTVNTGSGTAAIFGAGGDLGPTGYTFGADEGLTLFASPLAAYTIEIGFSFDQVDGYRRVADFLGGTSDTGLYILNGGLNFYDVADGPDGVVAAGEPLLVSFSRAADGTVVGSINGAEQFSFVDTGGLASFGNVVSFFIDDIPVPGESASGFVDFIRVYDDAAGAVPEPATWAMMIGGMGLAGGTLRRRKAVVRFA